MQVLNDTSASKGNAGERADTLLLGKAGGTAVVRKTPRFRYQKRLSPARKVRMEIDGLTPSPP
jgi:hypothetical protein